MLAIRDRSSFAKDWLWNSKRNPAVAKTTVQKFWKSAIPAFRRLKTPKKRIHPTVARLLVSNMTKTDSEAINIGRKIEMELIGAESCDEIRWCTGAFGLVLVN